MVKVYEYYQYVKYEGREWHLIPIFKYTCYDIDMLYCTSNWKKISQLKYYDANLKCEIEFRLE